jgi:hypothetical protein
VSSGVENAALAISETAAFGCTFPPTARDFTTAGRFCIARRWAGSIFERAPRSSMTFSRDWI